MGDDRGFLVVGGGVNYCKGRIHQIHCGQVAQQVKRGVGVGGRMGLVGLVCYYIS